MRTIKLTLNGTPIGRDVEDSRLLVEFLREDLKLTGTKESCGVGVCGACTVLLDGKPISSSRAWRISVRHLHARADPRGEGAARCQSASDAGGDPALDDGQSLPLHRLLQDYRIDRGRGRMT